MRRSLTTDRRAGTALLAIAAFCASMVAANWPLLTASTARLPGDLGDTRFIHYLLEHSWRWVTRDPNHPLWSPPFYYPVENTGAYSDIMVGLGIFYWPWRLFGAGPMTAFTVWIIICHALNFAGAWLLLRRLIAFSPLAAAAGASLFTTASPRLNQLNHLQFLPQFFVLMSLAGVIMLFQGRDGNRPHTRQWIAVLLAFGGLVLQFYSAFYYGWFLLFAYGIAAGWMLVIPALRSDVITMLRCNAGVLAIGAAISLVAMIPWAQHYLAAATLNPNQSFDDMRDWVPRYQSWFYMGRSNWLYGWAMTPDRFTQIPGWSNHEHRLGIGLITLLLAGTGLLIRLRERWIVLTVLVGTTFLVLSAIWPGGFVLWPWIFDWIPGASAVRTVSRIALMMLIPASLGVAFAIEWLSRHRQVVIALALIGLVIMEQGNDYSTWRQALGPERADRIASQIPAGCTSFYYSPEANGPNIPDYPAWMYQIDAMWAGLEAEVPTVNAYGHNVPPGWDLAEPAIRSPKDADRVTTALNTWEQLHPGAAPICHVVVPVP
jgi:hypothetical protein